MMIETEKYKEAARLIGPDTKICPAELVQNLRTLGSLVAAYRRSDSRIQSPSDRMDNLEQLKRAAQIIQRLCTPELIIFLDGASALTHQRPDWLVFRENARLAAESAGRAIEGLNQRSGSKQAIPQRNGTHRAGVDARLACAIIVMAGRELSRGSRVGLIGEQAKLACAAFWEAAGGDPIGNNGSTEKWRRYLETAAKIPENDDGSEIFDFYQWAKFDLRNSLLPT